MALAGALPGPVVFAIWSKPSDFPFLWWLVDSKRSLTMCLLTVEGASCVANKFTTPVLVLNTAKWLRFVAIFYVYAIWYNALLLEIVLSWYKVWNITSSRNIYLSRNRRLPPLQVSKLYFNVMKWLEIWIRAKKDKWSLHKTSTNRRWGDDGFLLNNLRFLSNI